MELVSASFVIPSLMACLFIQIIQCLYEILCLVYSVKLWIFHWWFRGLCRRVTPPPIPRPARDPLRQNGPPPRQCCHLLPMFDNIASKPREDKYLVYHLIFRIIHAVLNVH